MRVLLVDDRHERICHLQETLESDGHVITGNLSVEADLVNAIRGQQPDVIVIDLLNLSAAGLEGIARINRESPYPIVMFTADGSSKSIQKAVAAGISAYVVDGFNEQRITPILEIAVARFRKLRGLEVELEKTRQSLNDRKLIDRAKGLLMHKRGMNEDTAYKALRTMAMESNQRIAEVAKQLIAAAKILG